MRSYMFICLVRYTSTQEDTKWQNQPREKIETLTGLVSIKDTKKGLKYLFPRNPGPSGSTAKFYQTLKKLLILILNRLDQKTETNKKIVLTV